MVGRVQYILIAGAMCLLSHLSLTVNASILGTNDLSYENEAILAGTSIGQSVLREVAAKNFDERTVVKGVTSTDSLTSVAYLGPEAGEVYPAFDDVDDYKGHTRTVATDRLGNFGVSVVVSYAKKAPLGAVSLTPTFMKAITVTVSGNAYLHHDIVMATIVAY